jgi:hypothetical protein
MMYRHRGPLPCLLLVLLLAACTSDEGTSTDGSSGDLFPHYESLLFDLGAADGLPADGGFAGDGDAAGAVTHLELARHWAPVWYQDSDSSNYEGDYIVAYDFDGDTRSDNNWNNLDVAGVDLSAVIYYAVVETQTHWFLLYADFHPQDWDENCQPIPFGPDKCHENDMEGAMVVVRKDGSAYGAFSLLYTEAHNVLYIFTNDPQVQAFNSKSLQSSVTVTFEDGSHPELYVESKGHGVCALRYDGSEHCKHPVTGSNFFPGGDGIVYRHKGVAETPKSGNDQDVGYKLVPLETTLWARRKDICNDGCTFDGTMTYEGMTLGQAFDGDDHGDDKANPPWAWDDPDDGPVYRGDFFFRPAESVLTHLKVPGTFSKVYLHNPYLQGQP